jgi:CPA1 family monovalent cation:H+ antiporter
MVFGVAAFTLVVQGLSMEGLVDRLGLVSTTEAEDLYGLLEGRIRAVDAALDTAERLHETDELPSDIYQDIAAEYDAEKEHLDRAITELLEENPDLKRREVVVGERRVVRSAKAAVEDAINVGVVTADEGERLVEEMDEKLDRLARGEPVGRVEGAESEPYWKRRAAEYGLVVDDDLESSTGESDR